MMMPRFAICIGLAALAAAQCPTPPFPVTTAAPAFGVITSAMIARILDAHNQARQAVTPTALTPIAPLRWNQQLAQHAQDYISTCPGMVHSNASYRTNFAGFAKLGENLAAGADFTMDGFVYSVGLWLAEKSNYTYAATCASNVVCGTCTLVYPESCGHYTQIIWNGTTDVGCGYALCNGVDYYDCQYGPSGNVVSKPPYISGSPVCPNGTAGPSGSTPSPSGSSTITSSSATTSAATTNSATTSAATTSSATTQGTVTMGPGFTTNTSVVGFTTTTSAPADGLGSASDAASNVPGAAIAGIVIGGVIIVVLLVVAGVLFSKRPPPPRKVEFDKVDNHHPMLGPDEEGAMLPA